MSRTSSKRTRYEEFVAAHGDGLIRLAHGVCGDRGRAEDAVQEALTQVYERWSRISDPLAYARRTAINATRADWRRTARADRAQREAARLRPPEVDDPQARFLAHSALMAALGELPHGQRAVIVLRYGSGLSEAETAHTLKVTTGTVKSQTARALQRMRATLAAADASAADVTAAETTVA